MAAATAHPAPMAAATAQPARSGYIASPASDWFFLIAAPLVAVLAWLPFAAIPALTFQTQDLRFRGSFMEGFIAVGHPMPADDYWFVVKYEEQLIGKEFKAHFTLKR